jgi:putative transposase
MTSVSYRHHRFPGHIIQYAVWLCARFTLSYRDVEDLLAERGLEISYETVRAWWNRFGPLFAAGIRKRRIQHRSYSNWRWHLDEVFVKINGETHYLWRAVDHEGEVLDAFVTRKRDRKAALKFLRKALKRYARPEAVVTDRLRSYRSAMEVIGNGERQLTGRWLNNRAENSHQPFRRQERAMAKFRSAKSLQKFASIQSSLHNHFNQERHLYNRRIFKLNRSAALAEWRQLAA